MRNNLTIETILSSKAGRLNQHLKQVQPKKKKPVKSRNDCPQVIKMHWDLKYFCIEKEIQFEKEYKFHVKRKFRFDFFIPGLNCAVEYEGIFAKNSRHTNKLGYSKDTDKYSLAATMGIIVLRYTAINYENMLNDLTKIYERNICTNTRI